MISRTVIRSLASLLFLSYAIHAQEHKRPQDVAQSFEIEALQFNDATPDEAIASFAKRMTEAKVPRIKIVYLGRPTDRFDFALVHVTLLDVLQSMALDAGLRTGVTDEAIYLYPKDDPQIQMLHVRKLEWSTPALKVAADRAATQRATYENAVLQIRLVYGAKDRNDQSTVIPMPDEVFKAILALEESARKCNERVQEVHRLLNERTPMHTAFGG